MTHVTCRLAAKNRDQLWNPTLGNRAWATFVFYTLYDVFPCKDVPLAVPLLQLLIYGMKLPEIPILRA